jgi:hypothetical protein
VNEGLYLHDLRTDHVTIQSELRYLIGVKIVHLKCLVFGGNLFQWSGSGLEPELELNREFGLIANTKGDTRISVVCLPIQAANNLFINVCNQVQLR